MQLVRQIDRFRPGRFVAPQRTKDSPVRLTVLAAIRHRMYLNAKNVKILGAKGPVVPKKFSYLLDFSPSSLLGG